MYHNAGTTLRYMRFYVQKHIALIIICSNPRLVRDKPPGAHAFVRLAYCPVSAMEQQIKTNTARHTSRAHFLWFTLPEVLSSLQWRHNGRDDISNHWPHACLLIVYSGADRTKHQSSASPVNSPHKWPVTRKCFHLMTSSCCLKICAASFQTEGHCWVCENYDDYATQSRFWSKHHISLLLLLKCCQYGILQRSYNKVLTNADIESWFSSLPKKPYENTSLFRPSGHSIPELYMTYNPRWTVCLGPIKNRFG